MVRCIWGWTAKLLRFIQLMATRSAYRRSRLRFYAMLSTIMLAMLSWQVGAETAGGPLSHSSEQAVETLRRGTITTKSKLRTSPSMQSEVIAIAKEGTQVEILMEAESWFQVRTAASMQAWIYKPLVHIEPEPSKTASDPPLGTMQPDTMELLFASATMPDESIISISEISTDFLGSGASATAPPGEAAIPQAISVPGWFIEVILAHINSPAAYVISALIIALMLSIALQLRGAKHLRQATQEIGQILVIVEEMYRDAAMTPANDVDTAQLPTPARSSIQPQPTSK
jgi:SH3 domain-containing protein